MLTDVRWQKERELMQDVFPQFQPFVEQATFGFEGYLKGPRTGRFYEVVLEADQTTYPQCPPNVRMKPIVGEHWIESRGRRALCVTRNWQPARSTFANTLLAVIRYLDEHDGISRSSGRSPRGYQAYRFSNLS
jgi:ubiquitin-protein ligase